MYGSDRDTLEHAEQLLRQGRVHEARQLLVAFIKRAPDSVQAWWLLSQAVVEGKQQLDCLKRVLRLDPGHAAARIRLQELQRDQDAFETPEWLSHIAQTPEGAPTDNSPASTPSTPFTRDAFIDSPGSASASRQEALPDTSDGPLSTPAERGTGPAAGKKKTGFLHIALIAILICAGIAATGYVGMLVLGQKMTLDAQATRVMAQALTSHPPLTMPPTWTMTTTPTSPPSRTPTLTLTPSPTFLVSILYTDTKVPAGLRSQPIGGGSAPTAPDFTLKNVHTEDMVSLSDYRGRPVVLVFWVTWCGYCEREMSSLNSVYKTYRDHGLVVLAINDGESASKVRSYRKSHGLSFAVLLDPSRATSRSYNVTGYPRNVFIDGNGRIVSMVAGMMNTGQLTSKVKEILAY